MVKYCKIMAQLNVSCKVSGVLPLSMLVLEVYTHYTKFFIGPEDG